MDKISNLLYSNSRIELEFFMYMPTITMLQNGTSASINYNPIVNIRYKPSKYVAEEFDYMKATYKMTPRNFYVTFRLFNEVMKWLYDDRYADLFLLGEDGKIIFNADYSKLSVSTPYGDNDSCVLQAIPAVVTINDKTFEGIHLYINTSHYCVPLTYSEISSIFGILKSFSFSAHVSAVLTAYELAIREKRYSQHKNGYIPRKNPFE